ncbi:BA75_02066T0 [Komagataella pastoris]|uniref:RNA helicase n=1 Tax=Komagataella pastoris TaxID=4922 RepID=A0A1B2JCR3_PICPA|nr:BA75_02066T0 [Komagataella pastoris]
MSLSLNDILNKRKRVEKVQFLSKSKRQQLKLEKGLQQKQNEKIVPVAKKVTIGSRDSDSLSSVPVDSNAIPNHSGNGYNRSKKGDAKFQFQWDQEEDTSLDYQPLITVNDSVDQKYIEKDTHWRRKAISEMTLRDWRILKEDYNISSKGGDIPNPLRYWEESNIKKEILDIVQSLGFDEPTPIQRASIPLAMASRDLIGIAKTGSGKTLAYIIPALNYLLQLPHLESRDQIPQVLILVPTRELALQVEKEFKKFTARLNLNIISLIGGHSIEENVNSINLGCEIVVATPGRLLDCYERKMISLAECYYVVLDEADRMIDMGFEVQVLKILKLLPTDQNRFTSKPRNTFMFTATMSPAIQKITKNYLNQPGTLTVGELGTVVDTVTQEVRYFPNENAKLNHLFGVLPSFRPPIIIFVNYKKTCEFLQNQLSKHTALSSTVIHGSKNQDQRELAIQNLRSGKTDILIATDLAGRGIDIPNVSLVVNFQMANALDSYTHRIGRTGRAGNRGYSITYLGPEDSEIFSEFRKLLVKSGSKIPAELRQHDMNEKRNMRNIEL